MKLSSQPAGFPSLAVTFRESKLFNTQRPVHIFIHVHDQVQNVVDTHVAQKGRQALHRAPTQNM